MSSQAQVAAIAAAFLSGKLDPLTTIRQILRVLGDVDRLNDPDIKTLVGIDSETDDLPDPEHRYLWDPAALAAKDVEIEAYFKNTGPRLREACAHLVAKWSKN